MNGNGDDTKFLSLREWNVYRALGVLAVLLALASIGLTVYLAYVRFPAERQQRVEQVCDEIEGLRQSLVVILEAAGDQPPDPGETNAEQRQGVKDLIAVSREEAKHGACANLEAL